MEEGVERLKVYQLAHELGIRVHEISLTLPRFEMYEEGSQVRRSAKSVSSNIVEGFALRRCKNEFVHYLHRAYASGRETVEHLRYLCETRSLADQAEGKILIDRYDELNRMLFGFIGTVIRTHEQPRYAKAPDLNNSPEISDLQSPPEAGK